MDEGIRCEDSLPSNWHKSSPDHGVQNVIRILCVDGTLQPAQRDTALTLVRDVVRADARLHNLLPLRNETFELRAPVPPSRARRGEQREEALPVQVVERLLDRTPQHRQRREVLVRRTMTESNQRGRDAEARGEMRDRARVGA